MLKKSPNQEQFNIFQPLLKQIINPKDELVILAQRIDWKQLEKELSVHYSNTGTPSKPIRLMCGLLIIKQLHKLGDETVVAQWIKNPYYQYFCGEDIFQWEQPCDPSDLVHFRNRIGEWGIEAIFKASVQVHGKAVQTKVVSVDTTAQCKNITYPTDVKLYRKVIEKCKAIAGKEAVPLRQTYTRKVKEYSLLQRFAHHPKNYTKAQSAKRKLRTIGKRLTKELERKLTPLGLEKYSKDLLLFNKALEQQKDSKDKVYSLSEPQVSCIAKGKIAQPYEFGSKVSFATTQKGNIVVGVVNFAGNPHDSKTLESTLEHVMKMTGKMPEIAVTDRGYKGAKVPEGATLKLPKVNRKLTGYQKVKERKYFSRRAAIEPIQGHLKQQYGLNRCYLKGAKGDIINALLAATAFNLKSLMNKIKQGIFSLIQNLYFSFAPSLNLKLNLSC